jgi:hypothetical protein
VRADMLARLVYKLVSKNANAGDISALMAQLFPRGQAPAPGTVLGLNEQVDLEALQFQDSVGSGVGSDIEALTNFVAVGVGVPKEYLGIQGRTSRAGALVATEPAAKRFEDRQSLVERLLHRMADRVLDVAGFTGEREREFVFPAIATEDRSSKLKDLQFAESNMWVSKETAASTAAEELDISSYDYEDEQSRIAAEFADADDEGDDNKIRRPLIAATGRQVPKLDPTKAALGPEDEPPGVLVDPDAPDGDPDDSDPKGQTRAGFPGDENPLSSEGAANIRRDNKLKERRVVLTQGQLEAVIREAVAAGRAPRRRADDPDFRRQRADYRHAAKQNLDDLARDAAGG